MLSTFSKIKNKLIIAGNGDLKNEVDSIVSTTNTILNLGEFKADEIHLFFDKIDVLILPSLEEAGPLVGIEAMAAGKLILSTKVGAMMERLTATKNQFWFDSGDENSLLNLIHKLSLLHSEELNLIREGNRKVYLENYSINSISSNYIQLLNKI